MDQTINVKTLRADLADILRRVELGESFTLLYRSRPVCRIVPLGLEPVAAGPVKDDPLYGAGALGRSSDGRTAADHDKLLYGDPAP